MERDVKISDIAVDFMRKYGSYVVEERAIPDYRDGLKPVQRRIIYTAMLEGFKPREYKKSARLVGAVIGKFHPHGDAGVYQALVNLVNNGIPLMLGYGNWGSYIDEAAAYRYTETSLSELSQKYLLDKDDLEVVKYVDNFDGTLKEPLYLPAKVPFIFMLGITGIAVGTTVEIPAIHPETIYKALDILINKKKKKLKLDINYLYNPILLEDYDIATEDNIYIYPDYELLNEGIIRITGLPPKNISNVLERISEEYVIEDLSNENGINILIKKKRNEDIEEFEETILSYFEYRLKPVYNITVRKSNSVDFKSKGFWEILSAWLLWRRKFVYKVIENKIRKKEKLLKELEVLATIITNKKDLYKSFEKDNSEEWLAKKLKLDLDIVKQVFNKAIRTLTKKNIEQLKKDINETKREIKHLKSLLNDKAIYDIILSDMKNFIEDWKKLKEG